ncbi:MAG: tRNA pseudouridine(38-40) synthase TruA [Prevotella sp.]|nr:tRNA pseudouridine(38-40) synthase TruA [Prevotella sp.]
MRYFITFSYDGTRYHGWQRQPNGITVQQCLEEALSAILRTDIEVTGAGRTDTGVHASMMVAHVDLEPSQQLSVASTQEQFPQQLAYRLNRILPHDIAVESVELVEPDKHARFSATSRTYYYYLHTRKDPFRCQYSWETHYQLDFPLMNEAAEWLLGQEDFASFCKTGADVKTTLCHLTHAEWRQLSPTEWRFEITANRFLRNMVRAVVGTLVEVGRHRITLERFQEIVLSHSRTQAGESMPAHALFLVDIKY